MPIDPNYIDVAERITEFREKYPEGRLRPADPKRPYTIERVDESHTFIVYVAAAYRDASDRLPGIGMAWEPFPGPTNFTRDSELQNAETSAWGRAIVAALAADTKRGVASGDEIRNRQAATGGNQVAPSGGRKSSLAQRNMITTLIDAKGLPEPLEAGYPEFEGLSMREASGWIEKLKAMPDVTPTTRVASLRDSDKVAGGGRAQSLPAPTATPAR